MVSQFVITVVWTPLHHEFFVFIITAGIIRHFFTMIFYHFRQSTFLESQKVVLLKGMENCKWEIGWPQYVLPILCTVISCLCFVSNAFCIDVNCLVAWWLCLWPGNPPDISPCYILTVSAQDRTRSVSAPFLYFHSTRWFPYHCTLMLCILYQNEHSALYLCIQWSVHNTVHFDRYVQFNEKWGNVTTIRHSHAVFSFICELTN
jgi:hypothetical protein